MSEELKRYEEQYPGMSKIRWVLLDEDGNIIDIKSIPTITDLLEYAEIRLNDAEEFKFYKSQNLEKFNNLKRLLGTAAND